MYLRLLRRQSTRRQRDDEDATTGASPSHRDAHVVSPRQRPEEAVHRTAAADAKLAYQYQGPPALPDDGGSSVDERRHGDGFPGVRPVFSLRPFEFDVPPAEHLGESVVTEARVRGAIALGSVFERIHGVEAELAAWLQQLGGAVSDLQYSADPPATLEPVYLPAFAHLPSEERAQLPFAGATCGDAAFAYQHLNGPCPYLIRRVEGTLPGHCCITEADVAGVIGTGETLTSLIEAGRVFIVDTAPLLRAPGVAAALAGRCNAAPTALIFQPKTNDGSILPLAIQLLPAVRDAPPPPVFAPPPERTSQDADDEVHRRQASTWLAAKLFVNNAVATLHAVAYRSSWAALTRALAIAFRRCLPEQHPLHALTFGFSEHVIALGATAAEAPRWQQPLMHAFWRRFELDSLHVPRDAATRGIHGLAGATHTEDALAEWAVFEKFVRAVVDATYGGSDAAVRADPHLTDLASELTAPDKVGLLRGSVVFETRDDVTALFTTFCFHASVRFSWDALQWPWHAWVPAMPLTFMLDPTENMRPGGVDMAAIVAALPAPFSESAIAQRVRAIAIARLGSRCSRLTTGGSDPRRVPELWLSATEELAAARDAFYLDLTALETDLLARSLGRLGVPRSSAMLPSRQFSSPWY